jgi:hypothetical protein
MKCRRRFSRLAVSDLADGLYIFRGTKLQTIANDNVDPSKLFAGNVALALDDFDTDAALTGFIVALARNQARIDHLQSIEAANDNAKH